MSATAVTKYQPRRSEPKKRWRGFAAVAAGTIGALALGAGAGTTMALWSDSGNTT